MIRPLTVSSLLRGHAERHPSRLALAIDGATVTWKDLVREVGGVARFLVEDAGLGPGEHVAIFMRNSLDWATWALACACVGSPFVPVNTRFTAREIAYQLQHSNAALVVAGPPAPRIGNTAAEADESAVAVLGSALSSIDAIRGGGRAAPSKPVGPRAVVIGAPAPPWALRYSAGEPGDVPDGASPDDVLLIQYTSGTTAFPKGVLLTQAQVLANASSVARRLHLAEEDRICSASPFHHVAGTTLVLFLGLVTGASVYSFARFDAEAVLDTIENCGISMYCGVDALFSGLTRSQRFDRARVRGVRTGWTASSPEFLQFVHEDMGMPGVVNVYGLSEASPNVTIPDCEEPEPVRRTCGRPHPGTKVRIVDADREQLPPGATGLIEVRGPFVMKGYYADPEATEAVLGPDGWLRTGDLGHLDANGNLVFEGRAKDIIRVGGENVAPAEIEAVLLRHPDVVLAAVIGVPDDRLGQVPAAFVVPGPGSQVDADEVSRYASRALAGFKVPRQIFVVSELPMTGSEKVQRRLLVEWWEQHRNAPVKTF